MKYKALKHVCFTGLIVLCTTVPVLAQDTAHITLPEAEKRFLQKNLSLLAEQYNIEITKAQVIQARLFNNPTLALSGNLYDPDQKKVFNVSNSNGQYDIALQQMIRLAGKRNKEVKLAETATRLSENKFSELLRALRYSLRSSFYNLYYLQQSISAYDKQVPALEKLNNAYSTLQAKGIVSLKDAVRIKSLLYSLKAEQASLQNQLNDEQASFELLLQSNKTYFITDADKSDLSPASLDQFTLQSLVDTAYANRSDLKLSENSMLYNQQNYNLQKALASPDLTVGAEFDKRGSFVNNASFITVAMDLPFFNRNQGNIKAAKINIAQGKIIADQQKQSVENDVQAAWSKVLNTDKMLHSIDPGFENQFEQLLDGVTDNFQKKNISLVEFTDFYESYKNNVLQLNQLKNDRMQALESLQFAIGKNLFNN
ncbi:MAG: TolC family protein [Ferruginibacter sp.]